MAVSSRPLAHDGSAWACLLATVAVLVSLISACMMPFVAVAVATAATMPRSRAAATIVAAWAANQILGFGLLGFPLDLHALSWGVALCVASLSAMLFAAQILAGRQAFAAKLVLAFLAAFAGYEGGLFLFAAVTGGSDTFTAAIVLRIFANDLGWFAGLVALQLILARTVPRLFDTGFATRLA